MLAASVLNAYLDKDYTLTNRQQVVQLDQNLIFVLFIVAICKQCPRQRVLNESAGLLALTHEELLDRVETELLLLQPDLIRLRGESYREVANRLGEGGREQDDLWVRRELEDQAVRKQ